MKKALVTGGGGFLGGAIVRKLLRRDVVVRSVRILDTDDDRIGTHMQQVASGVHGEPSDVFVPEDPTSGTIDDPSLGNRIQVAKGRIGAGDQIQCVGDFGRCWATAGGDGSVP